MAAFKYVVILLALSVFSFSIAQLNASPVEDESSIQKRSSGAEVLALLGRLATLMRNLCDVLAILDYISSWFGPNCGGPNRCPPHHCQHDPAVTLGYCCGCAKLLDRAPIVCHPDMLCPLSGHQLCDDYNYMMDCCC